MLNLDATNVHHVVENYVKRGTEWTSRRALVAKSWAQEHGTLVETSQISSFWCHLVNHRPSDESAQVLKGASLRYGVDWRMRCFFIHRVLGYNLLNETYRIKWKGWGFSDATDERFSAFEHDRVNHERLETAKRRALAYLERQSSQ